jgi:protein phosphatase
MPDRSEAETQHATPLRSDRPAAAERPEPFSALVQVDWAGRTDPGRVRPNNEDHFLLIRFGRWLELLDGNLPADAVPSLAQEIGYGLAVADGVGGTSGGEVASRLALQAMINAVLHMPYWIMRIDEAQESEVLRRATARYQQVQQVLTEQAQAEPALESMGTTMTMTLSLGRNLLVAHIGDSRAYLFRDGKLHVLTRDHTVAQMLADQGLIAQEEVARSRLRHMLTRVLGPGMRADPDVQIVPLTDGDRLLLCTDGLTEMVEDQAIADVLARPDAAAALCRQLVDLALERGGKDNITVAVARYRFPPGP